MFDAYFQQLTHHTVLLTPNRRLAAILHEHYISHQKQQGLTCWPKPAILSINAWLESLWNDYLATATTSAPYLLNEAQGQSLWETIVAEDSSHDLLQITQTAAALKTAWELLWQYNVPVTHATFQLSDDYALCQRWLLRYQAICQEKNYIDHAMLAAVIAVKVTSHKIKPPENVLMYGFTELSPAYKKIVELTSSRDCFVAKQTILNSTSQRTTLPDPDSEIIAMARFAKAKFEEDPKATIGCVMPDLSQRRERVLQLFTQVFFPHQPYDIDAAHYPFNISAGKSLADYPVIATALLITSLSNNAFTREQFSSLLLSPYIGEAESESIKRAKFDAELRSNNIHQVSLGNLTGNCPNFFKRITQIKPYLNGNKRLYREWSQHFNDMLAILGWPGEKSLASEEYQAAQAWRNALEQLSSLDTTLPSATKQEAWQHLRQIIAANIFQPQSPKTNIQILGLLEAAAMPFDYLWVSGLHDLSWPPQPAPHPFIPKSLQRELNMPHATAARELQFCSILIEQFQQTAKYIIFSHAESDGKIHFTTSPLLQQFPEFNINTFIQGDYVPPMDTVFAAKLNETFTDQQAPMIPPQQKIAGGADAIRQQAACPFRAYATHRLHARELEASTQGLNHKHRGIMLHEVMQHIWQEIKSQAALMALDEAALIALVEGIIDTVVTRHSPLHHQDSHYIYLEKQRLQKIILQWLELEKKRPAFTVTQREEQTNIELNGHPLTMRIDRMDTLTDGRQFIIDYKSGKHNSTKKWYGDRPDEPQLPLYALIDPDKTAGIAFAQLAAGQIRYLGVSQNDLGIEGVEPNETWPEQLTQWRNVVEKLAADFCAGNAAVDPKRPAVTCKNCAMTPFCRIYEMTGGLYDDEAANEDASNE